MTLVVAFDCESDGLPEGRKGGDVVPSPAQFHWVQCTCACAVSFVLDAHGNALMDEAQKWTFWRDRTSVRGQGPFEPLLRLLDSAEIIVAYNGLDFDFPLLHKYYGKTQGGRYMGHRIKCLDPFHRIRAHMGQWLRLETLLRHNGLPSKSGSGATAIELWHANKREELAAYCMGDVERTIDIVLKPQLYGEHGTVYLAHLFGLRAWRAAWDAPTRPTDAPVAPPPTPRPESAPGEGEEEFVVVDAHPPLSTLQG